MTYCFAPRSYDLLISGASSGKKKQKTSRATTPQPPAAGSSRQQGDGMTPVPGMAQEDSDEEEDEFGERAVG